MHVAFYGAATSLLPYSMAGQLWVAVIWFHEPGPEAVPFLIISNIDFPLFSDISAGLLNYSETAGQYLCALGNEQSMRHEGRGLTSAYDIPCREH